MQQTGTQSGAAAYSRCDHLARDMAIEAGLSQGMRVIDENANSEIELDSSPAHISALYPRFSAAAVCPVINTRRRSPSAPVFCELLIVLAVGCGSLDLQSSICGPVQCLVQVILRARNLDLRRPLALSE